jgi:hypothetical protein
MLYLSVPLSLIHRSYLLEKRASMCARAERAGRAELQCPWPPGQPSVPAEALLTLQRDLLELHMNPRGLPKTFFGPGWAAGSGSSSGRRLLTCAGARWAVVHRGERYAQVFVVSSVVSVADTCASSAWRTSPRCAGSGGGRAGAASTSAAGGGTRTSTRRWVPRRSAA